MSPKAVITTKNLTPKTLLHPDRTVTNCGSECKISCHSFLLFQKIMFLISDDFCISWINLDSELFKICELLSLGTIVSKLHKKDQKVLFSSIANVSNKSKKFKISGALVRSVLVVLNVILWLDLLWFTMQEQSHKKEEANFSKNVHFLILRILLFKESVWYRAGQVRMQKHNLFFHYSVVLCGSSVWQHFVQ